MAPPPRTYHHGNLPQALVVAAIEAMAEAGDGNVNLRDIAARVGVSPAAPYKHFAGKSALIAAVIAEIRERLEAALASAPSLGATPRENAHALAEAFLMFAQAQPVPFRLLCGANPCAEFAAPGAMQAPRHLLQPALNDVSADGCASAAFWSLLTGFTLLWLDGGMTDVSPAAVIDAALAGLVP